MLNNFNAERVEKASQAMIEVSRAILEFNKAWDELTIPEKWATGGMVYHITSVWANFTTLGSLAEPPVAQNLVTILNNFVYHPEMFPKQNITKPKIE